MRKAHALKLAPGDIVAFGFDGRSASSCQLGIVLHVTANGGILVDVLHQQDWTGKIVDRRWMPYHQCSLWERARQYA